MDKQLLGPCITFFPQPTTLISTLAADGEVNVMTASWVAMVSKTPPTIAVSLHHQRRSYENIRASGEFTVNVVPADLTLTADFCGIRSGKDIDKMAITGLKTGRSTRIAAPLLTECPLNLECRLTLEVPLGDYRLLLAEVLEVHALKAAIRDDGSFDVASLDPVVYLGGIREYWDLGSRRATAYKDGLQLEKTE